MNLFGKKKAAAPSTATNPLETIATLRNSLETLEKREEHIRKKSEASLAEAKAKSQRGDKNGALFALKRKKMFESEITKLQGARITLDSQILALESATVNLETFRAMKAGASAMRTMRGNIEADTVDEMMDDLQEERDIQDSISEAISRPGQSMFDDDELLAELEELDGLEEGLADDLVSGVAGMSLGGLNMPSVPTGKVSMPAAKAALPEESEDERVLRELEASMMA